MSTSGDPAGPVAEQPTPPPAKPPDLQLAGQGPPIGSPSSQSSPASTTPLPHEVLPVLPGCVALHGLPSSTRQPPLQPSPATVFPSSHPSPASSLPLPQLRGGSQTPGAPPL